MRGYESCTLSAVVCWAMYRQNPTIFVFHIGTQRSTGDTLCDAGEDAAC